MTPRFPRRVLLFCLSLAAMTGVAEAQAIPQTAILAPQDTFKGIKHHVSFLVSGGFDLDVVGNVINGALGERDGQQVAVRTAQPWPEIYTAVPKRSQIALGYGVFQKDEVVARLSRTHSDGEPLTNAGNFVGPAGDGTVTVAVSPYRERTWELGWRHYMAMTRRYKQYANFMYGQRMVEPISMVLSTSSSEGTLGTFRLYDRSKLKSFSLEIGFDLDIGHIGLFAELGARWQQRLKRIDDDLTTWKLQAVNDNGIRFYMPAQFGIAVRF